MKLLISDGEILPRDGDGIIEFKLDEDEGIDENITSLI